MLVLGVSVVDVLEVSVVYLVNGGISFRFRCWRSQFCASRVGVGGLSCRRRRWRSQLQKSLLDVSVVDVGAGGLSCGRRCWSS